MTRIRSRRKKEGSGRLPSIKDSFRSVYFPPFFGYTFPKRARSSAARPQEYKIREEKPMSKTIYYNGTILTMNPKQPTAKAVTVKDGRIISTGAAISISEIRG